MHPVEWRHLVAYSIPVAFHHLLLIVFIVFIIPSVSRFLAEIGLHQYRKY